MSVNRVYLHYPFCLTLCRYCNFSAGAPPKEEFVNLYHQALIKEILSFKNHIDFNHVAEKSFYFGGGTPSLMPNHHLEEIFKLIPIHKNTEITLEINPETVTKEKAKFWKSLGINRVSLGWQSMNPKTLSFLGRSGTDTDNIKAFITLREEGFDNISVDRILSVANDTDEDFFNTLKNYMPDHISTYQLSIEPKTVLSYWTKKNLYTPIIDEQALMIQEKTHHELTKLGFHQYETSNYHRNNKLGQHNLGYWNYEHWLGLGAGASGFIPNQGFGLRYRNHFSFKDYIKNPLIREEEESINFYTAVQEALMLGIRKREGISKKWFEQKFNVIWENLFPNKYSEEFFIDTETHLILKYDMIPFTNPATISLWESLAKNI